MITMDKIAPIYTLSRLIQEPQESNSFFQFSKA